MLFFRKNKRQFAYRSHRKFFVAMFLLALFGSLGASIFLKVNAVIGPIASVEFFSHNSSFTDGHDGAWRVTKSARWTGAGKARITFKVESKKIIDNSGPKDVVMIIDQSGSMAGKRMDQVKEDASELIDSLLEDGDNRIAVISFDAEAHKLSDFSDDDGELKRIINSIDAYGGTSYMSAFSKANSLLSNYQANDDRNLIILFLTDGYPNDGNEGIAEYQILKSAHPNGVVHGIQYEMGDLVLQPIINVSDRQYIADINSLNNVLMEATYTSRAYSHFTITDYINSAYWLVSDENAISAEIGTASLEMDGNDPKIVWDMSGVYLSNDVATMTIDIELKSEYLDDLNQLLPTNQQTIIESSITGADDENNTEADTPILANAYRVSYDSNAPSDCAVSGQVPDATLHSVYSAVEKYEGKLTCSGYNFKGWKFKTVGVSRINDDYFMMPANDVEIVATWGKPGIEKSLDGTVNQRGSATFDTGINFNTKIRALSGENDISTQNIVPGNDYITGIVRSYTLPNNLDMQDQAHILSSSDSGIAIYGWYSDGIIYYYTDADETYLNEDASRMFFALNKLSDIRALRSFITTRTTNLEAAFCANATEITNLDPLETWDVSNVTNMSSLFSIETSLISNVDGLKDWNVSKVENFSWAFFGHSQLTDLSALTSWNTIGATNMSAMFNGQLELTSLHGLENWNTSNVTDMSSMFEDATNKLANVDELLNWNTSNVTNLSLMFASSAGWNDDREQDYGFANVNGLRKWDVQKVTNMSSIFAGMNNLTDISGLTNWKTDSVTDISALFYLTNLTNVDALAEWDVSNVTNMRHTFYGNKNLQNLNGLSAWQTGNLELMKSTFCDNQALTDISGLSDWNTSKLKETAYTFYDTYSLQNIDALLGWDMSKVETTFDMFFDSGIKNINGARNWRFDNLIDASWMFEWAEQLSDVSGANGWGMAKVETMRGMFSNTTSLSDITPLDGWTTSSLTDTSYMFHYSNITNIGTLTVNEETGERIASGGVGSWDMSHVTDMSYMFSFATKLQNIDGAANWNTSSVVNMERMFNEANRLVSVEGARGWDVSHVTNMGWLFDANYALRSVEPLKNWNVSSVTTLSNAFSSLNSLSSVEGLQNWNTSNVTNMYCVLDHTRNLHSIDELAGWDVSKVTNMANMFADSGIYNVNALSNWHPNSATTIANIFKDSSSLTDISGISGWFNTDETSKFTNMEYAFYNTKIENLDALAEWKTSNMTNMRFAFSNISTLTNVDGLENWDTSKVTTVQELFSGDTGITAVNAFEKLNGWNVARITNKTDAFKDIPEDVTRPTWY